LTFEGRNRTNAAASGTPNFLKALQTDICFPGQKENETSGAKERMDKLLATPPLMTCIKDQATMQGRESSPNLF
jgi:hypothetical protein